MLVNLTLSDREYILKAERPGYWDKVIADLTGELKELQDAVVPDSDAIADKQAEIKTAEKSKVTAEAKLAKYGPTVWMVTSIDKETLIKNTANTNFNLGKVGNAKEVSSGAVQFTQNNAVAACKAGLKNWRNLRGPDGTEVMFKRDLIGRLPLDILFELANVIMGIIEEEDEGNFEPPLSS